MYRRFNSPYVVLFMGAVLQPDNQMLVFEYMAEGNVIHHNLIFIENKLLFRLFI